jgi:hypothetical protein
MASVRTYPVWTERYEKIWANDAQTAKQRSTTLDKNQFPKWSVEVATMLSITATRACTSEKVEGFSCGATWDCINESSGLTRLLLPGAEAYAAF